MKENKQKVTKVIYITNDVSSPLVGLDYFMEKWRQLVSNSNIDSGPEQTLIRVFIVCLQKRQT